MKEKLSDTPSERRLSRRALATSIGATMLTAVCAREVYTPAKLAFNQYQSLAQDYSNDPFHQAVGAHKIDRNRLNILLGNTEAKLIETVHRVNDEEREYPDTLAEFTFVPEQEGIINASFEGLNRDTVGLAIFQVSIDQGEQFLLPLIATPGEKQSVPVQLGVYSGDEEHRLSITLHPGSQIKTIRPIEIQPTLRLQPATTTRGFIQLHQPDIYLRDYSRILNNFPYRSLGFVNETESGISVVYWNECLDGDLEYGRFGTQLGQLIESKQRPTDIDWIMEKYIDKESGTLLKATYAAPYHKRVDYIITDTSSTHTPVQIASANNNVRIPDDDWTLSQPKFRPLPEIFTHDEEWGSDALYGTSQAAEYYNMCENWREGTLQLPRDQWILDTFNADINKCEK